MPVAGDVGRAWSKGQLGDHALIHLANCISLPCPVCLVVMRVDGNAAGMRALFGFLSDVVCREGVLVAGFACRTRLAPVARVMRGFMGTAWDENDGTGDCRWWAPAEPGCAWLQVWRLRIKG